MCWCLIRIGTVVLYRCWWRWVCIYLCMIVCVQVWCSGLGVLKQWLSPPEPTLAPVCWSALFGCLTVPSLATVMNFKWTIVHVKALIDVIQFHDWLLQHVTSSSFYWWQSLSLPSFYLEFVFCQYQFQIQDEYWPLDLFCVSIVGYWLGLLARVDYYVYYQLNKCFFLF